MLGKWHTHNTCPPHFIQVSLVTLEIKTLLIWEFLFINIFILLSRDW